MSDFHQYGLITTLHRLPGKTLEQLEADLHRFAQRNPMTLILPSLYSELEGPALNKIIEDLQHATYINEIVVGLDQADETQFKHAREFFSRLPQRLRILWNDGPRLREIDALLQEEELAPQQPGKGRNVWYCLGYIAAANNAKAVALHDCDILTYSREIPARLFYPVASTGMSFEFCKGYYSRIDVDGKLGGRVTRLFVQPLIRALKKCVDGNMCYLNFLDSFRYPLSGEFSMRSELITSLRIPGDWGLEVGILSEVFRNTAIHQVCQVDIADNYDHKHQDIGGKGYKKGLSRMSLEIGKSVIRKLGTEGISMNKAFFRSLKAAYYREALDMLERYSADAQLNGLKLDIHEEEKAVELFAGSVIEAGGKYIEAPMEVPFIPNWNRVFSAIPDIPERLLKAVEQDNNGV